MSNEKSQNAPQFIDERQAAAMLGMSIKWLQKKRLEGGGPPFQKFGRSVRYEVGAIVEYANGRTRRSTSDPGQMLLV